MSKYIIMLKMKRKETDSSVVGGDAGDDKHEVEGDDEFDHKGLQIRASWTCPCEEIMLPLE